MIPARARLLQSQCGWRRYSADVQNIENTKSLQVQIQKKNRSKFNHCIHEEEEKLIVQWWWMSWWWWWLHQLCLRGELCREGQLEPRTWKTLQNFKFSWCQFSWCQFTWCQFTWCHIQFHLQLTWTAQSEEMLSVSGIPLPPLTELSRWWWSMMRIIMVIMDNVKTV